MGLDENDPQRVHVDYMSPDSAKQAMSAPEAGFFAADWPHGRIDDISMRRNLAGVTALVMALRAENQVPGDNAKRKVKPLPKMLPKTWATSGARKLQYSHLCRMRQLHVAIHDFMSLKADDPLYSRLIDDLNHVSESNVWKDTMKSKTEFDRELHVMYLELMWISNSILSSYSAEQNINGRRKNR